MKSKHLLLMLLLTLFVPWAAMAQNLCDPADMCEISYSFTDSWGDGWNGNYIEVVDVSTSTVLATWTLNSGASGSGTLPVCTNRQIRFDYTVGEGDTYPSENSWVIYDFAGNVIWEYSSPYTSMSQTYNVVCPSCPLPTLSQNVTVGSTTATLTWVENGEADAWVLQYGTNSDFTAGTFVEVSSGFTVEGTTITANINGLTGEQTYYARVRAACNTETEWSITASFTPTAAITATIYQNATDHCDYVPVYGYYADNKQQSEFIIPASQLSDLADGTIKAMTFYASYNFNSTASFQVYLKEVEDETISQSTFYGTEGATTVYTGKVSISSTNGMTITFTNNYTYNGGNLLVGFYLPSGGNYSSSGDYFIGKTVSGASHSSTYGNNPTQRNFIPTTTFLYLPSPTPKPKNLAVSNITSTGATLAWDAPGSATPTSYQYQYKEGEGEWTALQSTTSLSVALSLSASKTYTFQVRAKYDGVGESAFVETTFTTLDDCAFPTNLTATTTPGQGTKATLTWVKGYDETAWVLEYATNNTFTEGLVEVTDGFTVEGNNVTANLTGLTAEQTYYARVKANCGGSTSSWSNVEDFTPTYYVDFPYNANATSAANYTPFYGSYAAYGTHSRFIIPSSSLADLAGGTVRKLTFYSSATTADWGDATFKVYVAEVEASSFTSNPSTSTPFDWSDMTEVYSGSLSLANGEMVILLDEPFVYSGTKNLMIGFEETNKGTNATAAWYYKSGVSNSCAYAYKTYASATSFNTSRGSYSPKMTFNYRPTSTPRPIITEPVATTDVTATVAWTKPSDNVTGYKYQYKLATTTEWPTAWISLGADAVSVTVPNLTPSTSYDFQMKAVYAEGESVASSTSFATTCPEATAVPYKYGFETASEFSCWEVIAGAAIAAHTSSQPTHDGTTGSKHLKFSGTTSNMVALPAFGEATNTLRITLWTRPESITNSSCGSFSIGYMTNLADASTFTPIATYDYDDWSEFEYEKKIVDFNDPNDNVPANAYIALCQHDCSSSWYWFVDDVKVKVIPTCEDVDNVTASNVTNHSATIAWTADAAQAAWQIAYKAGANFNPNNADELATATVVNVTSNPYLFDKNLEAATTYYMYVRGNCTASSNGYGDWSDSYATFTTLAASPAPSNFVASNPASEKVYLVWTAGGGDYELSWDLYYLKSDDAPEVPTATTDATKTVTTLPTTEAPYQLTGLDPESRYYIWVRANHTINSVTTHSAWVALTGNYFTTIAACSAMDPVVSNVTHHNATVNWGGESQDGFTVNYRTAAGIDNSATPALSEKFDESSLPTGWDRSNTALTDDVLNGTTTINSYSSGWSSTSYGLGQYNWKMNIWNTSKYWLITKSITIGNNNILNFDAAITAYNSNSAPTAAKAPDAYSRFVVLITTDNQATWSILREWNNTGSADVLNNISNTGNNFSIDLSAYAGETVKIAFYGGQTQSGPDCDLHIDNVVVAPTVPAGEWQNQSATTTAADLTGLTAGTKYDLKVVPNCDATQESATVQFTTLDGNTKYFLTEGDWATAANWMDEEIPAITDNAIIKANATINNGTVAAAKKITFQGSPTPTLTINDGGQLQTDNTVTATVKKNITGYGAGNEENRAGYYLIANPLSSTIYVYNTDETYGMRTGTYDLYSWSRTSDLEWSYYGANNTYTLYMYNGSGYLYANAADVTLTFTGNVKANNTDVTVTPSYDAPTETQEFKDWNLYANPFVCNAYLNDANENLAFYRMNPKTGAGFIAATGAIAPMEGIFVQATATDQTFKFSRNQIANSRGQLNINLSKAATRGASLADNAIIRFGEGNLLEKFCFSNNSSKVYIPMEGKDYAVVNAESNVGEIPVSFEAKNNGTYTLSFTNEEVSFAYLHLIDNMTGIETDLLANPSYTFEARTTDYASRFKLVFATGSSTGSDTFAYYSNGNWVINNEGRATLQVVDVNGRILKSESINGCANVNFKAAAGIYMIRLVNGDNVKVQKVVVR